MRNTEDGFIKLERRMALCISRSKQTHLHKLAMILAASQRDQLILTSSPVLADEVSTEDKAGYHKSFSAHVGKTEEAVEVDKLLDYIRSMGDTSYTRAFKIFHNAFPQARDSGRSNNRVDSCWSGLVQRPDDLYLIYNKEH